MPATSKAQQRLMGMAYAYKKGELDSKEASQEVKDLADSMTLKQLKKYAATKHEGLPDKVDDNLQPGDVGGMGPIKFPTATEYGSGDVPAGQGDAEEEYKKKRRKMKHLKNFESFVNEAYGTGRVKKLATKEEVKDFLSQFATKGVFFKDKGNKMIFVDGVGGRKMGTWDPSTGILSYDKKFEESKVNEEYVELPSIDVPSTDLIEAFKQWYKDTADNWEDFKNDMAEDSVDEAAKNAQMEILANLSNEMNLVIKDRKFKVRMDLK